MKKKLVSLMTAALLAFNAIPAAAEETIQAEETAQVQDAAQEEEAVLAEEVVQTEGISQEETALEEETVLEEETLQEEETAQELEDVQEEGNGLTQDLVILFTSDVHCAVEDNFGLDGLYQVRQSYEEEGCHTVLVDCGNFLQGRPIGTITRGESPLELMNAVGYDIVTVGNQDFNYGMERCLELSEMADFDIVSANFNREGELVFPPYVIREFDGCKVAFVGVTTPWTFLSSTPRYFMDEEGNVIYGFYSDETGELLYEKVQEAVDAAIAEGADYVVALCHLGNNAEFSPWRSDQLITNTSGIDILVDGHSLDTNNVVMKNKKGGDVLRMGGGTELSSIGVITIRQDGTILDEYLKWDMSQNARAMFGIQNPVTEAIESQTNAIMDSLKEEIASSPVELTIYDPQEVDEAGNPALLVRHAETNLGDLCADAFRTVASTEEQPVDIALVNSGAIRERIEAGKISRRELLAVYPYGNMICVVEVSGQQVLDALEWGSRAIPRRYGGFLQVSGLTYEINLDTENGCIQDLNGLWVGHIGPYRVQNVMVGGEPLELTRTYTLATIDFLIRNKGDGYTMFEKSKILQDDVLMDYQVLADYVENYLGGVIGEPYTDIFGEGRITMVKAEEKTEAATEAETEEETEAAAGEEEGTEAVTEQDTEADIVEKEAETMTEEGAEEPAAETESAGATEASDGIPTEEETEIPEITEEAPETVTEEAAAD